MPVSMAARKHASTRAWRRSVLLSGSAMLLLAAGAARAADWLGTLSSDWFAAGNWNPAAVPGAATDVTINNGGAPNPATIGAAGAVARNVTLGSGGAQSGTLNVTGGALSGVGTLTVGDFGSGTVNISGGGTVGASSVYLAVDPGGAGTVSVSGSGSKLTASSLYVGMDAGATGHVTVQNGAALSATSSTVLGYFDATAEGTLTVTGGTVGTGSLTVGERGKGTFTLNGGATGTSTNVTLGSNASGNGTVDISGAGTTWATGGMTVGSTGAGTLTISDGAKVTTTQNNTFAAPVFIGDTATVTGSGSQWTIVGDPTGSSQAVMAIGTKAAATGSLTVAAGGKAEIAATASGTNGNNQQIRLGISAGSTGALSVTGAGSTFTTPYDIWAAYNAGTTGRITVSNGGALNTGYTVVGASGTGIAEVTGAGSAWTVLDTPNVPPGYPHGLQIASGATSVGSLTIANGGVVNVNAAGRTVTLGGSAGSKATLNIGGDALGPAAAPGTLNADTVIFATGADGTINFNHTSGSYVFAPAIQGAGPGAVNFLSGTTILTGFNTYAGTTAISAGATAQLGNGGSNGIVSGNIANNGALIFNTSSFPLYSGVISGTGTVEQRGPDTLTLAADNTYTGRTTISAGTLKVGNGGTTGTISNDVLDNSILTFDRSDNFAYSGVIAGTGELVKAGAGVLTLGGASTFTGGTSVQQGTLRLGGNDRLAAAGSLFLFSTGTFDLGGFSQTVGDLSGPGTVAIGTGTFTAGTANNRTFAGRFTGSGAFVKQGSGALTLTGNSATYTGTTTVAAGTLSANGNLSASAVAVAAGGTLTGTGSVGTVSVAAAGTLAGRQGQTLTTGDLALDSGSVVSAALGAPGNPALFDVTGNLTLDGTLDVTDDGGFGAGVYRIFDYGGSLTDNGLAVGSMPTGTGGTVQTAVANEVNLVVSGPAPAIQFWNGTTTTADGSIHGGDGTWSAGPTTNWTDAAGTAASAWGSKFAVFQTNPGDVTVDASPGAVSATAMQFIGQGWNVSGAPITLDGAGGSTSVRVGNGTLASASDFTTVASELTGNSRLVKNDFGTLILTGSNSYTGGTTVAAGTLQIGNGGTSGSIAGDVLNDAVLAFNRSDATTFGGQISGSGAVQLVSGDLTFIAGNSYTGGTGLAAGSTLRIGNGGATGSIAGPIANAGTLVFNRSGNLAFAGVIGGSGAIRQVGLGTTGLTGDSSGFAGTTTVENGILAVNGRLGGTLDVWAGGRLQGAGTVGDVSVTGVIAPGNSIGTLNVGNIVFNSGSTYEVEVDATGQSDLVRASGTATIDGGTVRVLAGAGIYRPQTDYLIVTATGGIAGVPGRFDGVTSNLAFLDPSLSYDANNVWLRMTRNGMAFQNVGITPNQIAAGGGVESLGPGNPVHDAVLGLSAPQARYAFDQLSGEIHVSARTAMLEDSRFLRDAVNDRIRAAFDGAGASSAPVLAYGPGDAPMLVSPDHAGPAFWSQAFGSWGHWNSDGNAARLDRSTGGFFIGVDAPVFDTWRFGAVAGYGHSQLGVTDRNSSGSSDDYHVGLYGGTTWKVSGGDLAFRTGAAYTWHGVSTSRTVSFPGFADSLRGDYQAGTAQMFGELAYGFRAGSFAFEPFANLAYVSLHTDGFTERGNAAALASGPADNDATFATLGLRASTRFDLGRTAVTLKGMVGWRHTFGNVTPNAAMRFAGGGNAFNIGGVPIARDVAVIEAGLDFALSPTATLGVSYVGQFGSGVSDQSARARFNMKF